MAYDLGGGGGTAGDVVEGSRFSLSKPYELTGAPTPEMIRQLNEMLGELYFAANRIDEVGLQGPSSATDGNLAVFDGTTGQKVRDGGVQTVSTLRTRTVVTDAQIQSLNTSPVEVIAAPGAGKFIVVIGCALIKESSAGAYGTSPNISLRWSGASADLTTAKSSGLNAANKTMERLGLPATDVGDTTDITDTAVVVRLAADVTGGNAANYLVVETVYFLAEDE